MTHIIDAQQRNDAIQPDASYLVQAPAGSGKTELLIQRILALLARVDHPEEILALTFTRKAAAEMRERVLLALQKAQLSQPKEAHAQATWLLARNALSHSDLKGWRLTSNPAQLRIMTIDAFASGLARQLPILSGFGQTPTTADFTEPLYQTAVKDLISYAHQRNAPQPLQQAVNTLILHLNCNITKLSDLLCAMLSRREQWLADVMVHSNDMQLFRQHLEECLQAVIEHAQLQAYESLPYELKGQLPALAAFAAEQLSSLHGEQQHLLSLQALADFPEPEVAFIGQWKALVSMLLVKDKAQARKSPTVKEGFPAGKEFKAQKETMKELLGFIADDEKLLAQLHHIRLLPDSALFAQDAWDVLEALFITLKMLAAQLWQTFEQHKKVDFVEVMLRAKQALGQYDADGNIMPSEALLRLDHQIRHILVDEFQDTSTLQIDLLSRLTAGWENDGRTLFMVGDPMQSIYRFRKAEVSLFLRAAHNDLPESQKLPRVHSLKLLQNFRSSPDIVDWVNKAFTGILPAKDDVLAGAISYTSSQAFKTSPGAVHLHLFKQRDDAFEADQVIDIVNRAKAEGKKVGILARNRSHLHHIMATLEQHGIAFRALEMLPLHQQPEIIDLRSLTCALLHPADQVAWAALLRSPAVGLSLASLYAIFHNQPDSIWLAMQHYAAQSGDGDEQSRLSKCIDHLAPALAQKGRVPLRRLVESTWLKLSMPSTYSQSQLANSDAYFELLEHIEDEGQVDIALLDQRLEKLFAKPEAKPFAEQVELMTMHGAKGLQWDTVILPGLGKSPRAKDKEVLVQTQANTYAGQQMLLSPLPHNLQQGAIYELIRDFEKQRDALEVARLLYVACTRAERELHLLGHLSEKTEQPAAASMLGLLWQDMESCYGAAITLHDHPQSSTTAQTVKAAPHQRIVAGYIPPEPDPAIFVEAQPLPSQLVKHKPEFSWAGTSAKGVGIALHAGLQRLAEITVEQWHPDHGEEISRLMNAILLREGLNRTHLDEALARCEQGFYNCLQSSRARWILSGAHQQQHNEWPLTYVEDRQCKHIVLDRSFIDAEGTRWIIDYKTGDHEGGDLEGFLDHELRRYSEETAQLPNYVKALKMLEPERTIKAALYFPMVDGWRVWNEA